MYSQDIPVGYISYYSTSFSNTGFKDDVVYSGKSDLSAKNGQALLKEIKDTVNDAMTPSAMMLVKNLVLGDFISTLRLRYTPDAPDSLAGVYFIAGLRDSLNYYYLKLDESRTSFNQVYKGVDSEIKSDSTLKIPSGLWQTVRIERDILKRSLNISCDGMTAKFSDPNLVMGYVGVGVCGYKVSMDKMDIWAPTAISRSTNIFKRE